MSGRRVRLGLLGLGRWGARYVDTLLRMHDVELVAICDPHPAARAIAAKSTAAVVASSLEEVLGENLDGVIIATPSTTHAALAIRCLEAGLHVLVEKPLATDEVSATAVRAAALAHQKTLLVGHLTLHQAGIQDVLARTRAGAFGALTDIRAERSSAGSRYTVDSPLWSLGAHDVATVFALLAAAGQPTTIETFDLRSEGAHDSSLAVNFSCGVKARFAWARAKDVVSRRLDVVGTRGGASFDEVSGLVRTATDTRDFGGADPPLLRQCVHFVECVRGQATPTPGPDLACAVVRLLATAQASGNSPWIASPPP